MRQLARRLAAPFRAHRLKRSLSTAPRRVVIGAEGIFEPGWVATQASELDLLRPEAWEAYVAPGSIDALLAEHVWEHLSIDDGKVAAATCFRFLKGGARLRVAVPDGYFPDPEYQRYIGLAGAAGGSLGEHKVVYTYRTLPAVFASAGFDTRLLEYHDENGLFHGASWDPADGLVRRSSRFDPRGPISVILDAIKPGTSP